MQPSQQAIKSAPKVELHCHLDGSVSPEALQAIIQRQGGGLTEPYESYLSRIQAPSLCGSLDQYLTPFHYLVSWLQTKEALELAAYDVLLQAAKENVIYMEIRFAPVLHMQQGLSATDVVEAVLRGMRKGEQETAIKSGLILCMLRGGSEQQIEAAVETAIHYRGKGVVGVDLAGNEAKYPPGLYRQWFRKAADARLPITIHAGENGPPEHVRTAIEMGASRIGHGLAIRENREILALCRDGGILLELCPVSNLQTKAASSIEEYPLEFFLEEGLAVSINTDNRTVSNTTLEREYQLTSLTMDKMKQLNLAALHHAFGMEPHTRKALKEQIECGYQEPAGVAE